MSDFQSRITLQEICKYILKSLSSEVLTVLNDLKYIDFFYKNSLHKETAQSA